MGEHLKDGLFKSDKYDWCPAGFVPLKVSDKMAQPELWSYAQKRRSVDVAFGDDLEEALKLQGFEPPETSETMLVYSLKEGTGTTIALSVGTMTAGWQRVELDWATLLTKRFAGNLTQKDDKALVARVRGVIEEAQKSIAAIHEEFKARDPSRGSVQNGGGSPSGSGGKES
jgi:hypothetical protein